LSIFSSFLFNLLVFGHLTQLSRIFNRSASVALGPTGANFINVLQAGFIRANPESAKKTDDLTVFFVLLGSVSVKAAHKMLVISTPGVNITNIL